MDNSKNDKQKSTILSNALIGGAGLGLPQNQTIPKGMAAVLLYVPESYIVGKTIMDIQKDIGLPWHVEGGDPFWFS